MSWQGRATRWWIDTVVKHHWAVLMAGLLITALSLGFASRLEVDSDMRALLPPDHPVVTGLSTAEMELGALSSLVIVVKGGSVEQRREFADAVVSEFEGDLSIERVDAGVETDFFVERGLYYLDDEEMNVLITRIEAWQHYEFCTVAPDVCIGEPDPEAPSLLREFADAKIREMKSRLGFGRYYERDGSDALVLFMQPIGHSDDFEFAERTVAHVQAQLDQIRAGMEETSLSFNMVGPYVSKSAERSIIENDIVKCGVLAMLGVGIVLYWTFRSARAVLALLAPLLCGVLWTLGATSLWLGHLNAFTSLISSVILGIGIDTGVHLLEHIGGAKRRGESDTSAIRTGFAETISPIIIASLTSIGAFAAMSTSSIPSFGEFGAIAGLGVAFCFVSMLTVYPALITVVGVQVATRAPRRTRRSLVGLCWSFPKSTLTLVFIVSALMCTLLYRDWALGFKDRFERNARELQSTRVRTQTEDDVVLARHILGRDTSASVLILDGEEELKRVYARASKLHAERSAAGMSLVADLIAIPTLLPSESVDQDVRSEQLQLLTEDWSPRTWSRLRDLELSARHLRQDGQVLESMLKATPFGPEQLPERLTEPLQGKSGHRFAIVAYPNYDTADIFTDVECMSELELYAQGRGTFVGEPTVYAAILKILKQEWSATFLLVSLVIVVCVYVPVRSIRQTVWCLTPLALSLIWTSGSLVLFDIRLTLINVPIIPAIIGIGVDNGVYLAAALRSDGSSETWADMIQTTSAGRAIASAALTTLAGFGSLLAADNGGVQTIGQLAVVGIGWAALVPLLLLPAVHCLVHRQDSRGLAPPSQR
jgi:predicted RND superfamily exporter protein